MAGNYGQAKDLEYFIKSQILFAISTVEIADLMIDIPQELKGMDKASDHIKTPGFKAVFEHDTGKSITIYDKKGVHDIVRPDQFYHLNDERSIKLMLK